MEDQQPETLQINLSRPDSGASWGFRLQGGVDFNTPLSVQVVQPKSIAERCGLRAGDGIILINNTNTDGLSHEQAKMEIIRSCNDIQFTVIRGAVQIWKPKVTPMSDLKPTELQPIQTATGDQIYTSQKTSLAKEKQDETCTIGNAYNRSAKPFSSGGFGVDVSGGSQPQYGGGAPQYGGGAPQYGGGAPQYGGGAPSQGGGAPQYGGGSPQGGGAPQYGGGSPQPESTTPQYGSPSFFQQQPQSPKKAVPNVVHAQFNSPIGLYSASNIASSYAAQTQGIEQSVQNLDVRDEPVGTRMTGTYQKLGNESQSYADQYGSPATPTSPGENVDTEHTNQSSGSPVPSSGSPESLQPENGLSAPPEHAAPETNPGVKPSGPSGFRSVSAPTPGTAAPPPPKQEAMHCNGCGNMVTGVFVRIKGMPYHEKCFTCQSCGLHLKQKGYFMIEGQLYCEVHARRVAQPPGDNMRAAGAVYR